MNRPPTCHKCGEPLPADAPAGLCPKCLVQAGFESQQPTMGESKPPHSPKASAFEPPTVEELARRFPQLEILELLGRGGMGAVYKARQRELDRIVAVKILPAEISSDPKFAERFNREARALARLSHPNIVAVYDFGQSDGLCFFVMEFVDGVNLRQAIQAGGMTPKEALAIVPQICDALQFAHEAGIVHRDIKPENILIDKRGRVKIADFGLAKLLDHEPADHRLTATRQVMGTLRYMAPEQIEGSEDVDHRADIFSLGVVFYELLTGELPVGRFELPSRKVDVDVRIDDVVLRALEQQPERRYQHASDVKTDVEGIRQSPAATKASAFSQSTAPPAGAVEAGSGWPPAGGNVPRFSRLAIIAAVWAPWFFIVFVLASTPVAVKGPPSGVPDGPPWWGWLLMFTLLPLGVAAPFGTTILGAIALTQIRHSRGRLYGLWLALGDVLLYPLLAIDVAIAYLLLEVVPGDPRIYPPPSWSVNFLLVSLTIVLILAVDAAAIYFAVRAARSPVDMQRGQAGAAR